MNLFPDVFFLKKKQSGQVGCGLHHASLYLDAPRGFACTSESMLSSCLHFSLLCFLLLNVTLLHLDDMATVTALCVGVYLQKIALNVLVSSSSLSFSLSVPQDGWQTLVSGLVAFLWLWHQHSQLHCLGKYLSFSIMCTVYVHVTVCLLS